MLDTLLRLRLFVATYEEGSFTLAARRENATQSGVTQHIQKLEDYLGVRLFVRGKGNGSVQPTPAGQRYYGACIEVLRAHSESRRALAGLADPDRIEGAVSVALTPLMTRAVLAPAVSAFLRAHPNVSVNVRESCPDMVIRKVRAGEVDFGVVPDARDGVGIRGELFGRTPLFLVSAARGRLGLRRGEPVRLRDLGRLKLVMPAKHQVERSAMDSYLMSSGTCMECCLEIDSPLGALDLVANTDWVSLCPAIMLLREVGDEDLTVSPVCDPMLLDVLMITPARESLQPAARAFAQTLRQHTTIAVETAIRMTPPVSRAHAAESAPGTGAIR